jgi:mannose-6-phosphate isomerase-like protein (cupin superfamily)
MSDYTIKNLMEIEDSAASNDSVDARFGRGHLDSPELGVSHFRYAPGYRASVGHSHRVQEEAYVVVAGSGRVKLDDDIVAIDRWDVVRVAPGVVRAFEGGPDGLELIVVGGRRPADGDGVRVEGFWAD